jgi:hypothetical protein
MSFEKKLIILTIVSTIVIVVAGSIWLGSSSAPQISASQNAKAYTISPTSADWGQIPMYKGNVTKVFSLKNTGTDTLKLFNIKTSCHCTKAHVNVGSDESPDFGMDSYSSWVGEVPPGKEAKLSVIFDPAYHGPSGVGPINRFVSVETNDKTNPKLTFTVTGTVYK